MKKTILCMTALAVLLAFLAPGCKKEEEPMKETTKAPEEVTIGPETTAAPENGQRDPGTEPVISPIAKERGHIKVLFIGNSFSVNVSHDLYDLLVEAGYEKVEVAVLFHGGCTLEMHCNYLRKDAAAYRLYYNGKGTWSITPDFTENPSYRMDQVLKMTQWDHIIFNSGGGLYGKYYSVDPFLGELVEHVRQYQPDAHLSWMVNWAWQEGEGSPEEILGRLSKLYGDQQQMYSEILEMTHLLMKNHTEIEFFIPVMTVMQNMRTSKFGDSGTWICRDGWHLSNGYGYYLGALACAKSIADVDIRASVYIPEECRDRFEDPALVEGLKAAVQDAFNDPWHVTENPYQ